MNKDIYERMILNITEFDVEDIIVTSGEEPGDTRPPLGPDEYESSTGMPAGTF